MVWLERHHGENAVFNMGTATSDGLLAAKLKLRPAHVLPLLHYDPTMPRDEWDETR
jgi:hypothetical protein